MNKLTELELSNLRHMLIFGEVDIKKYQDYADACQDQEVKKFFQDAVTSAKSDRQTLLGFLE